MKLMTEPERDEFLKTAYDVPVEYPVTFVVAHCKCCEKRREFIIALECYCSQDQGCGYTFMDEYGDCDCCNEEMTCVVCNMRQVRGT